MEPRQRRMPAPGVEEALSSMLWTPYPRTPSETSDDEPEVPAPKVPAQHGAAIGQHPAAQTAPAAQPASNRFGRLTRPLSFMDRRSKSCAPHVRDVATHLYPDPIRYQQQHLEPVAGSPAARYYRHSVAAPHLPHSLTTFAGWSSPGGGVGAGGPMSAASSGLWATQQRRQDASQLPSYELIEAERLHHSLGSIAHQVAGSGGLRLSAVSPPAAAAAVEAPSDRSTSTMATGSSAGIYFIAPYGRMAGTVGSGMGGAGTLVNSFTDDFSQYQVNQQHSTGSDLRPSVGHHLARTHSYYGPVAAAQLQLQHQQQQQQFQLQHNQHQPNLLQHPPQPTQAATLQRFSNDFSSLDLRHLTPPSSTSSASTSASSSPISSGGTAQQQQQQQHHPSPPPNPSLSPLNHQQQQQQPQQTATTQSQSPNSNSNTAPPPTPPPPPTTAIAVQQDGRLGLVAVTAIEMHQQQQQQYSRNLIATASTSMSATASMSSTSSDVLNMVADECPSGSPPGGAEAEAGGNGGGGGGGGGVGLPAHSLPRHCHHHHQHQHHHQQQQQKQQQRNDDIDDGDGGDVVNSSVSGCRATPPPPSSAPAPIPPATASPGTGRPFAPAAFAHSNLRHLRPLPTSAATANHNSIGSPIEWSQTAIGRPDAYQQHQPNQQKQSQQPQPLPIDTYVAHTRQSLLRSDKGVGDQFSATTITYSCSPDVADNLSYHHHPPATGADSQRRYFTRTSTPQIDAHDRTTPTPIQVCQTSTQQPQSLPLTASPSSPSPSSSSPSSLPSATECAPLPTAAASLRPHSDGAISLLPTVPREVRAVVVEPSPPLSSSSAAAVVALSANAADVEFANASSVRVAAAFTSTIDAISESYSAANATASVSANGTADFANNNCQLAQCAQCSQYAAMRLNVPAATVAVSTASPATHSASMYVPAASATADSGAALNALSIQVNTSVASVSASSDIVNAATGVSVVNCYRAVPVHVLTASASNHNHHHQQQQQTQHQPNNNHVNNTNTNTHTTTTMVQVHHNHNQQPPPTTPTPTSTQPTPTQSPQYNYTSASASEIGCDQSAPSAQSVHSVVSRSDTRDTNAPHHHHHSQQHQQHQQLLYADPASALPETTVTTATSITASATDPTTASAIDAQTQAASRERRRRERRERRLNRQALREQQLLEEQQLQLQQHHHQLMQQHHLQQQQQQHHPHQLHPHQHPHPHAHPHHQYMHHAVNGMGGGVSMAGILRPAFVEIMPDILSHHYPHIQHSTATAAQQYAALVTANGTSVAASGAGAGAERQPASGSQHVPPPYTALTLPTPVALLAAGVAPTTILAATPRLGDADDLSGLVVIGNEAAGHTAGGSGSRSAGGGGGSVGGSLLVTSSSGISPAAPPGATGGQDDGRFSFPLPIIRRSPSERSGKGCCGRLSLSRSARRAAICVVAIFGVLCMLLGGIWTYLGMAGPSSSSFTLSLSMMGVGMCLIILSGMAWRMTQTDDQHCMRLSSAAGNLGQCGRRPCSGRAPHALLYPEFQHRPPPPSYQASMQEYRLRLLLLDRDRQTNAARGASPPPTYRSHAGTLLRAPLPAHSPSAANLSAPGAAAASVTAGSEYSLPPSYRAPQPQLVHSQHLHQLHHAQYNPHSAVSIGAHNTSVATLDQTFTSTTSINQVDQQQLQHQQQHQNILIDVANNNEDTKLAQLCEVITHRCPEEALTANEMHIGQDRQIHISADSNSDKCNKLSQPQPEKAAATNEDDEELREPPPTAIHIEVDLTSSDSGVPAELSTNTSGSSRNSTATSSPVISAAATGRRRSGELVTIVTITGCTETESTTGGEMDILAHL